MIQRLSHVSIYVLDQDAAYDFYVNKLGFEVRTDQKMDNGFRWLTVGPKGQPGLQIVLMPTTPSPMMDQATSDSLRELIRKGVMGAGVFQTADCKRSYEEVESQRRRIHPAAHGAILRNRSAHERQFRKLVQHDAAEGGL